MNHAWGRGQSTRGKLEALAATGAWLVAACSGVEPVPIDQPADSSAGGTSGVYLHGSTGCGGENDDESASEPAKGGAPSLVPGDFGSGGTSGQGGGAVAGGSSAGGSGGQPAAAGAPGAAGAPSAPLGHHFLFSEYVEGSSTYKALEITAQVDSSFDGCRVALYFNGASTATGTMLEGTLGAGQTYVICSSALAGVIASCDRTAGLTFNGDDAITLECDGQVIDAIGQVGVDPGSAWGQGDVSLLDHTLRRSCEVTVPDSNASDAFEPALEWQGLPQDTFADLGLRDCAAAVGGGGAGGAG